MMWYHQPATKKRPEFAVSGRKKSDALPDVHADEAGQDGNAQPQANHDLPPPPPPPRHRKKPHRVPREHKVFTQPINLGDRLQLAFWDNYGPFET